MDERAFEVGQEVRVIDGSFADFLGVIKEIDSKKGKLNVLVSVFGRETLVRLEFRQVKAL